MATSGTYNFTNPQSKDLIEDAYERVGITPNLVTEQKILAAQRSLNFIIQSWINRGLNLWTIKQGQLYLNPNQSQYNLPAEAVDILEATIRVSNRNLGGVPSSSAGGIASNAFDGNPLTACTQTAPNGNISYNWTPGQQQISLLGVQSFTDQTYTLVGEYSQDGIIWTNSITIAAQDYPAGVIQWFTILVPTLSYYYRIRETDGATLNIAELYFNSATQDTVITRLSRAEYVALQNKTTPTTARPSSFYVDRQIEPVVYIWPTPSTYYNNMYYTYIQNIQDIGQMINEAQIPARFLEAICSKLAHSLAIKEKMEPAYIGILLTEATREFDFAHNADRERVPIRVYGDYTQGYSRT